MSRLSDTLPDGKFARGATVLPAGNATPEGTGRVLRALAVAALVGAVSFNVVSDAKAQGGYRAQVSGQVEAPSIDDLFRKSFGGSAGIKTPSVPYAPAPVASTPSVPAPVASAPSRAAPTVVPPAALRQAGAPRFPSSTGPVDFSAVSSAPSRAFLDLAEATVGLGTGNHGEARDRIASALQFGTRACAA